MPKICTVPRFAVALAFLVIISSVARAEHLPVKTYTITDGLSHGQVERIVRDSKGFLWFCTVEGISRFDGRRFVNYGINRGLPHRLVNDLLEAHDGTYWVATGHGLARLNPDLAGSNGAAKLTETERFTVFLPDLIDNNDDASYFSSLVEDKTGMIWSGSEKGLYRFNPRDGKFEFISLNPAFENGPGLQVRSVKIDGSGNLWAGSERGLYKIAPDGSRHMFKSNNGIVIDAIRQLYIDRDDSMWVATSNNGAYHLAKNSVTGDLEIIANYTMKDGMPTTFVRCVFRARDGRLWFGTIRGLVEGLTESGGTSLRLRLYTKSHGLSDIVIEDINEDRDGNLWLGSGSDGLMRIATNGFTSYSEADGLAAPRVNSIFEDNAGFLYVISGNRIIHRVDEGKLTAMQMIPPRSNPSWGWGWQQVVSIDMAGDWWIATGSGVFCYPRLSHYRQLNSVRPKIYTKKDGLPTDDEFRIYEDSHRDIWISSLGRPDATLSRWERTTGKFHQYTSDDGLPLAAPSAFLEDSAGSLWIGYYSGDLVRYRNNRFERFPIDSNNPMGMIRSIYMDHSNRLWIATTEGGAARIVDPESDKPSFVRYTTVEGLASNQATCIVEDNQGRIYIGTGRGIDRLDPRTNHIYHFSASDGLGSNYVNLAFRDHTGVLWFGTMQGLSRLVPKPDSPHEPTILVAGLRIAGQQHDISDLGQNRVSGLKLTASENNLQIDYMGLAFDPGDALRYQYKLEGADKDWGPPTEDRTVNYSRLSSGDYRFLVRAITSNGAISAAPAIVEFRILPPLWLTWWFISLVAIVVALAVYAVYRYRVSRLLELERVRIRIATDLHDDIGSSLSQVSALSEVVNRRVGHDPTVTEPLSTIADLSRDLVDSMNDIVWAINPRRDRLSDLINRMRRFASDVFTARDIEFRFNAPASHHDMKLGPELRRETYLIFKESINNIVRHSECTEASIEFTIDGGWLRLTVEDNGRGIDPDRPNRGSDGNGLTSMNQRATRAGGSLNVVSRPNQGTTVTLAVPLVRRIRRSA